VPKISSVCAAGALLALMLVPIGLSAQDAAATRTPAQVVTHHLAAFTDHDLEAVLSDYADDAIFIAPKSTVQGKAALRKMFKSFFSNSSTSKFPTFEAKVTADGDVGYEHWVMNPGKPGSIEGTDAFVVRHGKILFHTVVSTGPATAKP
jgi:uncharacterized protein (TIGR02246 family)